MSLAVSWWWQILQPATDAGAIAQWIFVLTAAPVSAIVLRRKGQGDLAVFVLGLGSLALAWFAARAFH